MLKVLMNTWWITTSVVWAGGGLGGFRFFLMALRVVGIPSFTFVAMSTP
jgi:hypothetical protein